MIKNLFPKPISYRNGKWRLGWRGSAEASAGDICASDGVFTTNVNVYWFHVGNETFVCKTRRWQFKYELHRHYKHVKFVNDWYNIVSKNRITSILKSVYMFYKDQYVIRYEMERSFLLVHGSGKIQTDKFSFDNPLINIVLCLCWIRLVC